MAKLIVDPTSPRRREIPLSRSALLTIGRDPSNDLVLADGMVSRRHAVVEGRAALFVLRDCGSANGSVVNGDRVSERELRDGDLVSIGATRLVFRNDALEAVSGKVVPHPSASPLRCPSCSADYRRGDVFCRECGAQVGQPAAPARAVCPACGAAVSLPARYCSACGESLANVAGAQDGAPRDTRPVPLGDIGSRAADDSGLRASGSMAMAPQRQPSARAVASRRAEPAAQSGASRRVIAPASPASRLLAALVDAVFVLSGQAVMLLPVGWYWWAREAPATPGDVALLPVVVTVTLVPLAALLGALYHVWFWSVKGATPGKELLDLRVEMEDGTSPIPAGRAWLRLFGYVLGAASLGVGFVMVAFAAGLHDRVAGTRVTRVVRR